MKDLSPQLLATAITIGLLLLLSLPAAIRAYNALDFNKFKRVTHHLLVVIAPSVFFVHPVYGPRRIPDCLYTDGLTPKHTMIIVPHSGAWTGEQLTRYISPETHSKFNLLPTIVPATNRKVIPERPLILQELQQDLQAAIDAGYSEGSTARSFIDRIHFHLRNVLTRQPGSETTDFIDSYVLSDFTLNELSVAVTDVLDRPRSKKKLGALLGACFDQQVTILIADDLVRFNTSQQNQE